MLEGNWIERKQYLSDDVTVTRIRSIDFRHFLLSNTNDAENRFLALFFMLEKYF